jgi:hypothetical protein
MISILDRNHRLLPPPVGVILLYAADGLSVWNRSFSRSRRPRTPERAIWVPMFRQLTESPEGLRTLKALAEAGMRGWGCPEVYLACVDAAFRDIGFRARAIAALEDFADTARERFTVPEPPRHPPAAADIRPRPETAKPGPAGPTRPGPRPRGPRFGPR